MRKLKFQKRVICAMSGGIDSSVAAALLKKAGFDVVGVFMKFWSEPSKNGLIGLPNKCCSPEAEKRARLIASILDIPFYVLNFQKEFKKKVVDYFLKECKRGLTPNPCVVCNKKIKFQLLFQKFPTRETDFVATGHYAKTKGNKIIKLLKGKDKEKDQSYFLWQLSQKQLNRILFPIGDYTKTKVRLLARGFKLPLKDIHESQEICFVQTTVNDFLGKYLKSKPGAIVDTKGKIVGRHYGLYFYTIGQRKGIKLSEGPYYVLNKNLKENILIVTKNEKDLYKKELIAKNINWITGKAPKLPLRIKVKIRYRHKAALAIINKHKNGKIKVVFSKSQRAITPGQSVVFYKNQEVLGGGTIT